MKTKNLHKNTKKTKRMYILKKQKKWNEDEAEGKREEAKKNNNNEHKVGTELERKEEIKTNGKNSCFILAAPLDWSVHIAHNRNRLGNRKVENSQQKIWRSVAICVSVYITVSFLLGKRFAYG